MAQTRSNTFWIYAAALICLIAVGFYMFSKSDFFNVKEVRTEGLSNVTANEVLQLLGTVKGENIFLTDSEALAMKVKLHPLIDQVQVKKELPATLVVKVQERVPVAMILTGDGVVVVDLHGVILKFYDSWPAEDNPVLTGIEVPETIGPGQKINNVNLNKALLLLGQAPAELLPLIGEVHSTTDGQISLYMTSGIEVKIGFDAEFTEKLKLLQELLNSEEYKTVEKAIKYIDLTAGKPVLGR
ncbi:MULTISPECIES: FtsQ-type POTRA domain-containing protein [Dehalobacter]|uniref:Cell division protein FtsQ n=1 Tax=Dehalobacter restrictus (strain DSM 9455 / PER-K23) TaxID=871738 RepID=A0ABN4BYQ3_DEHRP|nr:MULTISPECIES: FtsQ-type POTRA domain-containing protein [Dehalobacter]AHF10563.1 cell division protein FtsQ [Dehalobacter restrictus DSM 9455]MDJ0305948.1 cell division protein FtsQ/DivIB [Dehalobacter sp.]